MSSKRAVFLLSRPGEKTRRLVVTPRRLISATFVACFALASGFWAGWQLGVATSSLQQVSYDR
jgi:hypothetical protein